MVKKNSCVCGPPRELFINNRVKYNTVLDDDGGNNNYTSLLTFVIVDKNLTRLGFGCMTATFRAIDRTAHMVVLCSACFVYGKYF
jgi:hypothetical protein